MLYSALLLSLVIATPQECMFNGEECSGHGRCHVSTDGTPSYCVCDSEYTLSPTLGCVVSVCYNEVLDMICNNGDCQQVDGQYKCVCPSDLYFVAGQCTTLQCIVKDENNKATVCSGHGFCGYSMFGDSKCVCWPEYEDGGFCQTCNMSNANLIDGQCVSKKCMTVLPDGTEELCGGCGTCIRTGAAYDLTFKCTCPNTDSCKEVSPGICGVDSCISDSQLGVVCNDVGVCDQYGCHCKAGYSGISCLTNDNDPNACQSHYVRINGACVPEVCVPKIPGDNVCGGQEAGECIFVPYSKTFYCSCFDGYVNARDIGKSFDYQCVPTACIDEMSVCYQGACLPGQGPYPCVCLKGYHNDPETGNCVSDICFTGGSQNPGEICSGHGQCKYYGCACDPGYGGEICNQDAPVYCYEGQIVVGKECVYADCVSYTPEMGVCGGFGTCVKFEGFGQYMDFYECQCDENTVYHRDYLCLPAVCLTEDGQVCPHGSCQKVNDQPACVCNNGYRNFNGFCYPMSCLVTIDGVETACANNGVCDIDSGVCNCNEFYHGEHCDVPKDHDIVCDPGETLIGEKCISDYCIFNEVECSGHGYCDKTLSDGPRCACDLLYVLSAQHGCVALNCYNSETDSVCPNGKCIGEGKDSHCECDADFTLVNSMCIHNNCLTDDTVCSGNGNCIQNNLGEYTCQCDQLHSGDVCRSCASNAVLIDGLCASGSCVVVNQDGVKTVCSGMGVCKKNSPIDDAYCVCKQPFLSVLDKCVSADCYSGEPVGAPCNGRGYCGLSTFCTDPSSCRSGQCFCTTGYAGSLCENCASNYVNVPLYGCIAKTCYKNGLVCSSAGNCVDGQCQCVSGYRASGPECIHLNETKIGLIAGGSVAAVILLVAVILGIVFGIKKARKGGEHVQRGASKKGRALISDGDEEEVLIASESESGTGTVTDEIP